MPIVELVVDRSLLCSNFDGYKLSFDPVPVLRQDLDKQPLKLQPHSNQYSLLHSEIFSMHNLLCSDPWERNNNYFVNTAHEIVFCSYDQNNGRPREARIVHRLERNDNGDGASHVLGDYNYSMRFISEKYCILCDGINSLLLLDTGDRLTAALWKLVSSTPIEASTSARGFLLYDARLDVIQNRKQISTVVGHVNRRSHDTIADSYAYFMQLTWARWTQDAAANDIWVYNICEHLETTGSLYYCAFEPRADSLVLCSNRDILTEAQRMEAMQTDQKNLEEPSANTNNGTEERMEVEDSAVYSWSQNDDDIVIRFKMRPNTSIKDFNISCSSTCVKVAYLDENLLEEELFAPVEEESTTWTTNQGWLQMILVKKQQALWPQLLITNSAPPQTDSSEKKEQQPTNRLPVPNLEDPLEECDFPLGSYCDDIKMVRYNLTNACITHTIFLGQTPPLFCTSLRAGFPAAFATRQGVDAALWLQVYQPAKPNDWTVRHDGNLHAFGYIQASKEQRKFMDCSPDQDYAVICESFRHVFIYKPRYENAEGLRKRNGPQVAIGKQNLITLDEISGEVLGLSTAKNVITVLTEHAVFYLQV